MSYFSWQTCSTSAILSNDLNQQRKNETQSDTFYPKKHYQKQSNTQKSEAISKT